MGQIYGINLRKLWRGVAIAALTSFMTVQLWPYLALAALPSRSTPPDLTPDRDLLAQLADLPNGTIALPNFDPAVNGFQFSNQELIQAIDLNRNAQDWEEVLTEQLQQLFGPQVCIGGESATCVLTAAAQSWLSTQLGRMEQGLSEGMAAAVLDLWQPTQSRLPWWQRLINFVLGRSVFALARNLFELQTFIANLFLMQGVTEVFQQTETVRNTLTPTQILLSIVRVFLTGSGDPFTMGVYRLLEGVLTDGHALTPYRVEDRGSGKYWVYVYDSNYPSGRPTSPTDLHVEFDTEADTWVYQPTASGLTFAGNARSKTLDLTQRSWRHPAVEGQLEVKGFFTCPFCRPAPDAETATAPGPTPEPPPESSPEPTVDITLVGEGVLTVAPYREPATSLEVSPLSVHNQDRGVQVPFKGGLNREVPASYHLPAESLGQALQITLAGLATVQRQPVTLQIAGPGYTANVEGLVLSPSQSVTLFLVPNLTGPELTFLAQRATVIPLLSISLSDETRAYQFNSSTPESGFSLTHRQVAKSSEFSLSGLRLPVGKRVAMVAKGDLKRLYFADDNPTNSRYDLTVTNRMVIKDRIQVGDRQPDFVNYTLTYTEDMRASGVQVEGQEQAFFDYDPAFLDPANLPRQALLDAFEQRAFPLTIAYEPLGSIGVGPLELLPSGAAPIEQRVFQGSLRKSG